MKIHIIQHESFESPGAIVDWAKKKGHAVSYSKIYQGAALPKNADHFDFLIVMGGPQSPATTQQECPHFDAAAEIKLIQDAIAQNRFVLGACLGAQLIGEACGAKFDHSPEREIGVFEVTLTEDARHDPIFAHFPKGFKVGHWHGDMPGLTPGTKVLAKSQGCPRQIVRYAPRVYGFQCHFEFNPAAIEGMIKHCSGELEQYKGQAFIETAEALRAHDYEPINQLLFRFLDEFVK